MNRISIFMVLMMSYSLSQDYEISYNTFFEGKLTENQDPVIVYTDGKVNYITSEKIIGRTKEIPFEITKVDLLKKSVFSFGFLKNSKIVSMQNDSILSKYKLKMETETKKILGYNCKKAVTSINSNTIEIWYTNDLNISGGPSILGQKLGLVLEIVRNGNNSTKAIEIQKGESFSLENYIQQNPLILDELTYKEAILKSRYTTISVFKDELIRNSEEAKSDSLIQRFDNGVVILKKVKFPKLVDNNIFVNLTEQSNGDAYDRTGTVFIIPDDKKESLFTKLKSKERKEIPFINNDSKNEYYGIVHAQNFSPTLELMRFFTPFGVHHFNHLKQKDKKWEDNVYYRQDISELASYLSEKELWVGTIIGNYDKGGHKVSLDITIHKQDTKIYDSNFILPLFNNLNSSKDFFSSGKGIEVEFYLEKELKNAKLRYITTGHGGWENGDEFVPKRNSIFLDDKEIYSFIPWRTDCGSYRLYNPASGNFSNGLSSSDYSRSNWCPGTITNPNFIELGNLKEGKHTIRIQIPQGANEGSSHSSWKVSGVLMGLQ